MAKLANKVGGMILMGRSQSSTFPTRAALQSGSGCYPWTSASACKVKGIVQLETGCFGNLTTAEVDTLKHIPILIMYGDYSAVPQPAAPCPTEISQITAAGGDIKFASLPDLTPGSLYPGSPGAIHGNEHMMMPKSSSIGRVHAVCKTSQHVNRVRMPPRPLAGRLLGRQFLISNNEFRRDS
jgi:hypothetical protein